MSFFGVLAFVWAIGLFYGFYHVQKFCLGKLYDLLTIPFNADPRGIMGTVVLLLNVVISTTYIIGYIKLTELIRDMF